MNRREFVSGALATGTLLFSAPYASGAASQAPSGGGTLEFYELRRYLLRRGPKQAIVDAYWRDAALPAMKRLGVGPVGVFNVMIGPESPTLHVLITHSTLDSVATLPERLAADAEYQKAAESYLSAPATDPAFVRVDVSVMRSITGLPHLALPFGGGDAGRRARIFELRTYESHSEMAARKKIEMFNTGEIAIFRKAGLTPVFFGQTLAGRNMPNLTYMLVYEDMPAHDREWAAFGADPDWRKLSTTPGFTDPEIVQNITNMFLRPTPYSQI
jgi:hypothetical protein